MTDEQAPSIRCAACGEGLRLQDVVIVSREVLPAWVSPVERASRSIFHKACERSGGRDDHNWMREVPQTLSRVLVGLAIEQDQLGPTDRRSANAADGLARRKLIATIRA